MKRRDVIGTIYVLHFDRKFHHTLHYIGWTERDRIEDRLREHSNGSGARILDGLRLAEIGYRLACTFVGTRRDERRMKRQRNHKRFCKVCSP